MRNLNVPIRILAVVAVAILSMFISTGASADIVSTPSADGYLSMGSVFYDTRDYLLAGTYGGMFDGYSYMKFDSLPTTPVQSATLKLTSIAQTPGMFPVPEAEAVTISARAATADVANITDATSAIAYAGNIGAADGSVVVSGGDVVYSIDITNIVNQWISTGNNYGLMLTTATTDMGYARFHSSESAIDGAAPYIVSVVPEPATLAMLCAGSAGLLLRRKNK